MSIFEAIIQGIVQGATEFLPVSSSGHLSLAQHIMGVKVDSLLFDILLHLGTLIAVCAVYYKLIWRLIKAFISLVADVFCGKFKWGHFRHQQMEQMQHLQHSEVPPVYYTSPARKCP